MSPCRFPIPSTSLLKWVPHRAPALWVDEVLNADEAGGECLVHLNPDSNYSDGQLIRPSSYVEWMAQAYAFAKAARLEMGIETLDEVPKKAFLAAFNDVEFSERALRWKIQKGQSLKIRAIKVRELGPIALISGEVLTSSGETLAKARLKVFAG